MWKVVLLKLFIEIFFLAIAFLVFIPKAVVAYQYWKNKGQPREFSNVLLFSGIAVFFLLSVYLSCMVGFVRQDLYGIPKWGLYGVDGVLMYLSYAFFIPQAISFFRKWKEFQKPLYFSSVLFFSFLAWFSFSFVLLMPLVAVWNVRF